MAKHRGDLGAVRASGDAACWGSEGSRTLNGKLFNTPGLGTWQGCDELARMSPGTRFRRTTGSNDELLSRTVARCPGGGIGRVGTVEKPVNAAGSLAWGVRT